jgi:hypothetical protein
MMSLTRRSKIVLAATALVTAFGAAACGEYQPEDAAVGTTVSDVTLAGSLVREVDFPAFQASMVESVALERLPGLDAEITDRGRTVTAALTATGVNLSVWRVTDTGALSRAHFVDLAGVATRASITALGAGAVVVALSAGQNVTLRLYQVNAADQLVFRASTTVPGLTSAVVARIAQGNTSPHQIVVAGRDLNGKLKLFAFSVGSVGPFTTLAQLTALPSITQVAIAPLPSPRGVFTTAAIKSNGLTEVRAWKLSSAGSLSAGGVIDTDDSTTRNELAAASVSYGRVATFARAAGGTTRLALYNVDSTGAIALHNAATQVNGLSRPALVNGGGGRLFLAGKSSSGVFTLESWEAINQLRQIDSQVAGSITTTARPIAVSSVRGDRAVTAAIDSMGGLHMTSWRDYNVPLVRGTWPLTMGAPTGAPTPGNSAATFNFLPFTQDEPTATIAAASQNFVVVSGSGRVAFFDKAGAALPQKNVGVPTQLTYGELFAGIIAHRNADGSVNQQSLRRHLEFQSLCDPELPFSSSNPCPSAVISANVVFDLNVKRFVISANLLYLSNSSDPFQRHAVIAISKTEDPRDGFHLYGNTESMFRGEPRLSAQAFMAILSFGGTGESVLRPSAYVYDLVTLSQNAADVNVTKLTTTQTRVGLRPTLQHFGSQPAAFLVAPDYRRIYGFQKDTRGPVSLRASEIDAGGMPMQGLPLPAVKLTSAGAGVHSGHLYVGGSSLGTDVPEIKTPLVLRNPITWSGTSMSVGEHELFPFACPMRTPENFSCEFSDVTVNASDNVLVSYVRLLKSDPAPEGWPSSAFTWFQTFDETTGSTAIVRPGEAAPTTPLVLTYTQAVPDPAGVGFWTVHKYGTSAGVYRWVAGRAVQ